MHKTTQKISLYLTLIFFVATGMVACGDEEFEKNQNQESNANQEANGNQEQEDSIATAGTWDNQFDMTETIDDEMWDYMYLIDFDNDERWAITQNPDDDEHNPAGYNRLEWTPIEDDTFYYCTAARGLDTEEEALQAESTADDEDLDEGCAGFEWTEMVRQ